MNRLIVSRRLSFCLCFLWIHFIDCFQTTTPKNLPHTISATITALGYRIDDQHATNFVSPSPSSTFNNDPTKSKLRKKKHVVYKHLFRNYGDISFDSWLRCQEPESFLMSVGYSKGEIQDMEKDFHPLLSLNVHDQLAPKIRFLVETLEGGFGRLTWNSDDDEDDDSSNTQSLLVNAHSHPVGQLEDDECKLLDAKHDIKKVVHSMRVSPSTKAIVPATFFGCQLDRVVGPFHAYLHTHNLPHGRALLEEPQLLYQFLRACCESSNYATSLQNFVELCQAWSGPGSHEGSPHTKEGIELFLRDFVSGLIPASKGLTRSSSSQLIPVMLMHGANPLEYDNHGVTPLLYAAGSGDMEGFRALADITRKEHEYESILETLDCEREPKLGASAFHWACCGVSTEFIGEGGSFDICRWILEQAGDDREAIANLPTWNSKSTPLMWAAWAGSLEIVDLLLIHGAKLDQVDSGGRNALHWSAAAGHSVVVEYLMKQAGGIEALNHIDHDGKRPVDYAKMYDRDDVIKRIEEFNRKILSTTTVWTL